MNSDRAIRNLKEKNETQLKTETTEGTRIGSHPNRMPKWRPDSGRGIWSNGRAGHHSLLCAPHKAEMDDRKFQTNGTEEATGTLPAHRQDTKYEEDCRRRLLIERDQKEKGLKLIRRVLEDSCNIEVRRIWQQRREDRQSFGAISIPRAGLLVLGLKIGLFVRRSLQNKQETCERQIN